MDDRRRCSQAPSHQSATSTRSRSTSRARSRERARTREGSTIERVTSRVHASSRTSKFGKAPPWKADRPAAQEPQSCVRQRYTESFSTSLPASARPPPWQKQESKRASSIRQADGESFGYSEKGVSWCKSGNGEMMIFVDGDEVPPETLSCAKQVCGAEAYWDKDLERLHCKELNVLDDGGWPADMVTEGHCDRIVLPYQAGHLAGLSAAAMGGNKKTRQRALALGIALAAAQQTPAQDFGSQSLEMRSLLEVSRNTYNELVADMRRSADVVDVDDEEEEEFVEDYDYDSEDDFGGHL